MSFILDALRRSEQERQRGEAPAISSVPLAVARRGAPVWAIAAIVLLGASLLVVGWGWWRTLASPRTPATIPAKVAAATPSPAPAHETPASDRLLAAEPAATPAMSDARGPQSGGSIGLRELAAAGQPPRVSVAAAQPAAAPPASTPPAALLPSLGELRAEGVAIPELTLELHVYSDDPAKRFVFINGARYRDGDTLKEGPTVRSIRPEGVVLESGGREFLLPRS